MQAKSGGDRAEEAERLVYQLLRLWLADRPVTEHGTFERLDHLLGELVASELALVGSVSVLCSSGDPAPNRWYRGTYALIVTDGGHGYCKNVTTRDRLEITPQAAPPCTSGEKTGSEKARTPGSS